MSAANFALTASARLDLLELWNYLAENASLDIADEVAGEIEAAILVLVRFPALGHRRADLTRRKVRFYLVRSYAVVYRSEVRPLRVL